jgi:hypothetical protein
LNDYFFFSAPQLKRDPLGSAMDSFTLIGIFLAGALFVVLLALRARGGLADPPRNSTTTEGVIGRADQLRKWDPVAADRVLDAHFDKEGEREDAERAALRTQAQTDRAAAEELRRRLLGDLEVWAHLLKGSGRKVGKDARMQDAVTNLEQWDKETRVELEQLDALIKRLNA